MDLAVPVDTHPRPIPLALGYVPIAGSGTSPGLERYGCTHVVH